MAFKDVIVCAYSCPPSGTGGAYPPDLCGLAKNPWMFEQIWAPLQVKPFVINMTGTGPLANDFSQEINKYRNQRDGFLRPFIKSRLAYSPSWPKGTDVGRIALVGFSAGCGALKSILSMEVDAKAVDFVLALDGLHGQYKSGKSNKSEPNGTSFEDVDPLSIAPWTQYAIRAAKGECMMVVTHSKEIVAAQATTTASTAKSAGRLILDTLDAISEKPQPQVVPEALLGMNGKSPRVPTRQDGTPIWPDSPNCWPVSYNSRPQKEPQCSWPVGDNTVTGNLITLGTSMSGTGNEASHNFHAYWMHKAVMEEVLAPRWTFECETGAFQGKALVSGSGFVKPTTASTTLRRNPKLMRRFGSPALSGIGDAFCDIFSCEGVFSGISGTEIDRARLIWQASWLAASAAAAGGIYYLLKTR